MIRGSDCGSGDSYVLHLPIVLPPVSEESIGMRGAKKRTGAKGGVAKKGKKESAEEKTPVAQKSPKSPKKSSISST